MSRGTRVTPIRLNDDMLARIRAAIASANLTRADTPYDLSAWIRAAIEEKLAKLERGRRAKKRPGQEAGQAGE